MQGYAYVKGGSGWKMKRKVSSKTSPDVTSEVVVLETSSSCSFTLDSSNGSKSNTFNSRDASVSFVGDIA